MVSRYGLFALVGSAAALAALYLLVPGGAIAQAAALLALPALALTLAGVRHGHRRVTSELARLHEELGHGASHDQLTGLGNRLMLMERLAHAIQHRPQGPGQMTGLLVLDLDRFKTVNDTLGHDAGDRLLMEVSRRIQGCVRPSDTVARLGGDEFVVVLEAVDTDQALRVTRRLVDVLREPVRLDGHSLSVRTSAGLHLSANPTEPGTMLRNADLAMYSAKQHGGDRYELFEPELHRTFLARHELEIELRDSVVRDELVLHYQTIVDVNSAAVVGVEALIRWNHPARGLLYPDSFIELAETSGAIIPMGRWVLREACRQLREWMTDQHLPEDFTVAVNVSRRQLLDPNIVEDIAEVIQAGAIPPHMLVLEVTETALMTDTDQLADRLQQLRELGVTLAMDDFGTGYSSLDQLRHLPIDILKIDRAFVDGIARGSEDFALATAIVRLAASLGKQSLAEGVETAAQLAHLRTLKVNLAQGYLFAKPAPAAEAAQHWHGQPERQQTGIAASY
jgi:diguanylate cyclase (GGDEF)-like protein